MIRGGGVAANVCAHLLRRAGFCTLGESGGRASLPAIMIGKRTQGILEDIFENKNLFDDLPRIRKRVVAWGVDSTPSVFAHDATVLSERALLNRILPKSPLEEQTSAARTDWVVFGARPFSGSIVEHEFGSRLAVASSVTVRSGSEVNACWIESVPSGWLFLLPQETGRGCLLSVGASPQDLLAMSRVVAAQIASAGERQGDFACAPRIAQPLCGARWLACGTAAIGFDPLCGDGTGNAAREAILASAIIRAARSGEAEALLFHYGMRLIAGFKRHLEICHDFYRQGRCGPWWDEEIESLRRGLKWCADQLAEAPTFRYRLNGFVLEAVDAE
jgi:hypothetical protein